jgi:hypothetical protein
LREAMQWRCAPVFMSCFLEFFPGCCTWELCAGIRSYKEDFYFVVPWLCASRRPVHRRLRGVYEFCLWISMPDCR